jgi:hypothetical protein
MAVLSFCFKNINLLISESNCFLHHLYMCDIALHY